MSTDAMSVRSASWCALALLACGASRPEPKGPHPAARCSDAELLSFDAGVAVTERGALPPMAHVGGEQTQNLAQLPCGEQETHSACEERARREAEEAFAEAVAIDVEVVADEQRLVVRYRRGGDEREERFETLDEAQAALADRAAEGPLALTSIEPEAAPGTDWSATIAVTMPKVTHSLDIRRAWLRFAPGPDPLVDLATLQRRAEAEGYILDTWRRLDDASIRIEVRCLRPAP